MLFLANYSRRWSKVGTRPRARAVKKLRKMVLFLCASLMTFLVLQAPTPWGYVPLTGDLDSDSSNEIILLDFPINTGRALKEQRAIRGEHLIVSNRRNTSSYKLVPVVSRLSVDPWNDSRERDRRRPRLGVLLVTSSRPEPCGREEANELLLKAAYNKLDYCRMHDFDMFYNMAHLGKESGWAKLPLIRTLMLSDPSIGWIWWTDSRAVFTHMSFAPNFEKYENYNLVLYGGDQRVYQLKELRGLSTRNFFLRNCQWSLDLIDAWSSLRPNYLRKLSGDTSSLELPGRESAEPADEQLALVYLLSIERLRWASGVYFERSLEMSGNWKIVTGNFNSGRQNPLLGLGSDASKWPLVTDFADNICELCFVGNITTKRAATWESCRHYRQQLGLAYESAATQVERHYKPLDQSQGPIPIWSLPPIHDSSGTTSPDVKGENLWTKVYEWDASRKHKRKDAENATVLVVSGLAPKPCHDVVGDHVRLKVLKNKMDYGRMNGMKLFFSMYQDSTGQWAKLSILRGLMLTHPHVEWFWWIDEDWIFTDMELRVDVEDFDGYNLVFLSGKQSRYAFSKNFLIRNCQWSLDLLDEWDRFRPIPEEGSVAKVDGDVDTGHALNLTEDTSNSPDHGGIHSALMKLMGPDIDHETDEWRRWAVHRLLDTKYALCMDAECLWAYEEQSDNTSSPLMTHFQGCEPCPTSVEHFATKSKNCTLQELELALRHADNQVLELYGLHYLDSDI